MFILALLDYIGNGLHVFVTGLHMLGNGPHVLGNVLNMLGSGLHVLGDGIMSFENMLQTGLYCLGLCHSRGYVTWNYVAFGIPPIVLTLFGIISFGFMSFKIIQYTYHSVYCWLGWVDFGY